MGRRQNAPRVREPRGGSGQARYTAWIGWLPVATLALCLAAAGLAQAQFGAGFIQQWTTFHDPAGRFSLDVPPGWMYQPDQSDSTIYVFFGTGTHDLFYVEILEPTGQTAAPPAQAEAYLRARGAYLPGFRVISQPAAGTLAGKEAVFLVYSYTGSGGMTLIEGRAFVEHRGQAFTMAFADEAGRFESQVPTFNSVMESLVLPEAPQGPLFGFGLPGNGLSSGSGAPPPGVTGTGQPPAAGPSQAPPASAVPGSSPGAVVVAPSIPATTPSSQVYTSPGGFYRFTVPAGWELWEEQSTSRGDAIEPWNDVQLWPGRPMTKTLFIWDYFDEAQQLGRQLEFLLAVVENVPGTLDNALETLKNNMTGTYSYIYTFSTRRVRVAGQNGVSGEIVLQPYYGEPAALADAWFRRVSVYAFKQGNTLFFWMIPKDVEHHPAVTEALGSLQWLP